MNGRPPGDSPKCPLAPVNVSEMLAQAFILIAEQQRALLEQQHQHRQTLVEVIQLIIERPPTTNFIAVEVKGDIMVDNSTTDSSIHVGRDAVGIAQTGATQQFMGDIRQNTTQLQSNPETRAAAEAINKLSDAIAKSPDVPSEYERETYLRDLKMLSEQAALPKEKRQPVTPIIDRISGFCSGAGGLAAIWAVAGPPIIALFS